MKFWLLAGLVLGSWATAQEESTLREAVVVFPPRLGDCPPFEEFRRRGYARLQAGVVHPLRMLARTQAEAEKARCEEMRTGLEKALAADWSGWGALDGFVDLGSDSATLTQVLGDTRFDVVHAISLEVTGLDVERNGSRFEHLARFRVVASSWSDGARKVSDSSRRIVETRSVTGFGELAAAVEELSRAPRDAAGSILENPSFERRAHVLSVDSSGPAPTFAFLPGPGRVRPGRRFRVLEADSSRMSWGVAWDRETKERRRWSGRWVGGDLPPAGSRLREIPGDLAWQTTLGLVPVGGLFGGELRGGPRYPIGPSLRVGVDVSLRTHDFSPIRPSGLPLGWGGGVGLEPDISFQRNLRRWIFAAGFRSGLRLDLAPVQGSDATLADGWGWARRGELVATGHAKTLFALDPARAVGLSFAWDFFHGRGAWDGPDGDISHPAGADSWRLALEYHLWP
ncbi:MAG: hypothetical protein IPK50_09620 [Fibrobacterota bacterium]|nr:hypothetical protein [Fibrobacterota bacterium]QQS07137.1 MAG: hypothetical protein IPK50_09620 [Fibrobacterota bacterium]